MTAFSRLPPRHHLAALFVASLLTVSILAELLVGSEPILLWVDGNVHVLPALTATQVLGAAQTDPERASAVWPLIRTSAVASASGQGALVAWWLHATRYAVTVAAIIALVSTVLGLVLGWLASTERRVSDFALRHAVALCGSLPSLILVGVARVSGRFPVGLDLIVVLLVLRSVDAAHLVRTVLVATRDQEFTLAARCVGGSRWHLLSWHLLPHLSRPLASLAASTVAGVVALEAALSLIGLGVPQRASWGAALIPDGQAGAGGSTAAALCAVASLLLVAAASLVLARQVRRDRWVEQRHV